MSGSSRRFSQRNLQRPASQPVTPVRRVQASVSEESLSEPVTPVRLQRRAVAHPSPRLEQHQLVPFESPPHNLQRSPLRPPHSAARRLAMNTQRLFEDFNPEDVDLITVNLNQPERNREVMVFTVNDVQHQSNMYNCFTIMLRIDPRDAAVTDRCTAYVVSETEVLISYPALEYFFFTDSAARNERLKVGTDYDPQVQLAQDICINDVRRAPQRVVKRLLLQFPEEVTLANVFNQYSYVIRSKMPMDYASTGLFGKEPVKVLTTHMQWMIADLNTHRQAVIEAAEATPLDLLSANFARMFETTSGNMSVAAPIAHSPFATPTDRFISLSNSAASVHQPSQPSATTCTSLNANIVPYAATSSAFVAAHCHKRVVVAPVHQAAARPANPFAASSTRVHTLATSARMSVTALPAFATTQVSRSVVIAPSHHAAIPFNEPFAAPQQSHTVTISAMPSVTTAHQLEAAFEPYLPMTNGLCMPNKNATMQLSTLRVITDSDVGTSSHPLLAASLQKHNAEMAVPNVENVATRPLASPMQHVYQRNIVAAAAGFTDATMDVNDVGFVIGAAQVKKPSNMRPIEIDKRRLKRPPSGSTPMRKELGSPRKRNCAASGSVPLMLEDAAHRNTRQRSSPRLQEMVLTVQQRSQDMVHMDDEDASSKLLIDKRCLKRPPSKSTPMRKELGSPRKRNCAASGLVPLMLANASRSQEMVDMDDEDANSKDAANVLHSML